MTSGCAQRASRIGKIRCDLVATFAADLRGSDLGVSASSCAFWASVLNTAAGLSPASWTSEVAH